MIDTRDYDLATLYRFKLFFDRTYWYNVPNLPISEIRNERIYKGERLEFPLLALRRVAAPIMYKDAQNNWAAGRTGDMRGRDVSIAPDGHVTSADMTMVQTNYELKYMLDVFSFERDNFDELVIEVQENIFRHPYLTFENWKDEHLKIYDPQVAGISTNITWESTEDNTDLESFNSQTPFYRATITFTVRAYIYRKYAALLIEDLINGYRILDYNKITRQIVDSDYPYIPPFDPDHPQPTPEPDPSGKTSITGTLPSESSTTDQLAGCSNPTSNPIGCIRTLILIRLGVANEVLPGNLLDLSSTGISLRLACAKAISTSSSTLEFLSNTSVTVSGIWATLTYIPSQSNQSDSQVVIYITAVRVA